MTALDQLRAAVETAIYRLEPYAEIHPGVAVAIDTLRAALNPQEEPVTVDFHQVDWHTEAERAHAGKKCYPNPQAARQAAEKLRAKGEQVGPYRCPWGAEGARHWHIGHPPSIEGLERIAAAIRNRTNQQESA